MGELYTREKKKSHSSIQLILELCMYKIISNEHSRIFEEDTLRWRFETPDIAVVRPYHATGFEIFTSISYLSSILLISDKKINSNLYIELTTQLPILAFGTCFLVALHILERKQCRNLVSDK